MKTGMSYGKKEAYEPEKRQAPQRKIPVAQKRSTQAARQDDNWGPVQKKPASRPAMGKSTNHQPPAPENNIDAIKIGSRKKTGGYNLNFGAEAYGDGYEDPMAGEDAAGDLAPCNKCGRTFNAQALQKHAKICVKVFQKQRKVFNMQEQRVVDGEQM